MKLKFIGLEIGNLDVVALSDVCRHSGPTDTDWPVNNVLIKI